MRLAGNGNWWAPAPLRRVYQRFGIHEAAPPLPPQVQPEPAPLPTDDPKLLPSGMKEA